MCYLEFYIYITIYWQILPGLCYYYPWPIRDKMHTLKYYCNDIQYTCIGFHHRKTWKRRGGEEIPTLDMLFPSSNKVLIRKWGVKIDIKNIGIWQSNQSNQPLSPHGLLSEVLKELKHEVAKQLSAAHTPKRQRMSQTATSGKHICKHLELKAQGQWAVCIPASRLLAEILTKHKFVTDYNMQSN